MSNRVKFQGQVARDVLLQAMGNASALVHPSLHEEAGFVVAEALALGTPVVCLDRGGPPVLTAAWPNVPSRVVRPSTAGKTARDIGAAVDNVAAAERGTEPTPPNPSYTQGLLEAYEKAVAKSDA